MARKKRGCGKRNWRRGPRARWKCKVGKRHAYKAKHSRSRRGRHGRRRARVHYTGAHGEYSYVKRKSRKKSASAKRKWKQSGLYKWMKSEGRI